MSDFKDTQKKGMLTDHLRQKRTRVRLEDLRAHLDGARVDEFRDTRLLVGDVQKHLHRLSAEGLVLRVALQ